MADVHVVTVRDNRTWHLEHPLGCFGQAVADCGVALHLETFGLPADTEPGTYQVVQTLRGGLEWAAKADD